MSAEELFLNKYGNKIMASESWVIRFAEEYGQNQKQSPVNTIHSDIYYTNLNRRYNADKSIEEKNNRYKDID